MNYKPMSSAQLDEINMLHRSSLRVSNTSPMNVHSIVHSNKRITRYASSRPPFVLLLSDIYNARQFYAVEEGEGGSRCRG